jgi:hypothetical protein
MINRFSVIVRSEVTGATTLHYSVYTVSNGDRDALTNLVSKVMGHAGVSGYFPFNRMTRVMQRSSTHLIAALIALAFVALIAQIGDFVSTLSKQSRASFNAARGRQTESF